MRTVIRTALVAASVALIAIIGVGQEKQANGGAADAPKAAQTATSTKDDVKRGEKAFQNNCGRCHNPPQQLSPKSVGSVLRHMRVRAMLSPEDERAILQYIAP